MSRAARRAPSRSNDVRGTGALGRGLLAIATGLLVAVSLPPFDHEWLVWVALVPLLWSLDRSPSGRAAWTLGFVAGLPVFLTAGYGFLPRYAGLGTLIILTLSVTLGGVCAAYVALTRRAVGPIVRPLLFPATWLLGEQLAALMQMPWSLAYTQTHQLAVLQAAALFGPAAIVVPVVAVNGGVASLLQQPWRGRDAARAAFLALLAVGASLGYGEWSLRHRRDGGQSVTVASIQPVFRPELYQYQGLNPDYRRTLRDVTRALSVTALEAHPDFLVWPEGGSGQFSFRVPALREEIENLARRSGSALLISSHDLDEDGRLLNAVFSVAPDGRLLGRSSKVHLAPLAERHFTAADALTPLATPHGAAGILVCIESIFTRPARDLTSAGAVVLVVTTSDASLDPSTLALFHHRVAILRAVENRRAVIQASNTGPSMIVSPYGEVTAEAPLYARTTLHGIASLMSERTLYTRLGDWPMLALALAVVALALRAPRRQVSEAAAEGTVRALVLVAVALATGALVATASMGMTGSAVPEYRGSWRRAVRAFVAAPEIVIPEDAGTPFRQSRPNTCGAAALANLLHSLGMTVDEHEVLRHVNLRPDGITMLDLARAGRALGLQVWGEEQNFEALATMRFPVIAHVRDDHYVVIHDVEANDVLFIFDPSVGYLRISAEDFRRHWKGRVLVVRFPPLALPD